MPILKPMQKPNGATVNFHKAIRAEVHYARNQAILYVAAWPSQEAHDAGLPLDWMWDPVVVPIEQLAAVEDALLALPDSPFLGGAKTNDGTDTVEAARARRWAQIKEARAAAEFGGFIWNSLSFDSDPTSVLRISGAATEALIAQSRSEPFERVWTLADKSTVALGIEDMFAVGRALAAHVDAQHQKARNLYLALQAAQTISDVEAVQWQ